MQEKYIVVFENNKHFEEEKFITDAIEQNARVRYSPLSGDLRTDTVKKVHRKRITMNDHRIGLSAFFESEEFSFDLTFEPIRILGYKNNFQNSITYEISLDQTVLSRKLYNFFDFLRDIGGLFSALGPIFATIVFIFQYRGSY